MAARPGNEVHIGELALEAAAAGEHGRQPARLVRFAVSQGLLRAEIGLDQHHPPPEHAQRLGEPEREAARALPFARRRHHDRAAALGDARERQSRRQIGVSSPTRSWHAHRVVQAPPARDRSQHRSPESRLELERSAQSMIDRLEAEHRGGGKDQRRDETYHDVGKQFARGRGAGHGGRSDDLHAAGLGRSRSLQLLNAHGNGRALDLGQRIGFRAGERLLDLTQCDLLAVGLRLRGKSRS